MTHYLKIKNGETLSISTLMKLLKRKMKINNYVIACELDGVVFDFEYDFCTKFGTNNRHLSNLFERYPDVDKELIQEFLDSPDTYRDLLPIFGGITFVRIAQALGFGIIFLTSRPVKSFRFTKQALKYYELNYNDLVFTKDKSDFISRFNASGNQKIRMLVDDIPAKNQPTQAIWLLSILNPIYENQTDSPQHTKAPITASLCRPSIRANPFFISSP